MKKNLTLILSALLVTLFQALYFTILLILALHSLESGKLEWGIWWFSLFMIFFINTVTSKLKEIK
jgi:hypothetical protein